MNKIKTVATWIAYILIVVFVVYIGYSAVERARRPANKTTAFTEPTSTISKDIEREVAKNGSAKFDIESMHTDNPENLFKNNTSSQSSLSMEVTDYGSTQTLNVNILSPIKNYAESKQGDILIFIPDASNIHYVDNIKGYVEIKNSPNKYYIQKGIRLHSYVVDVYINKNDNTFNSGTTEKNSAEKVTTQQTK